MIDDLKDGSNVRMKWRAENRVLRKIKCRGPASRQITNDDDDDFLNSNLALETL